jgi:monofunctional glycosyltransferase
MQEFQDQILLPEKPKRKWKLKLFVFFLLVVTSPVTYTYLKCPWMGWYRTHFPKTTSFMDYRAAQAKKKGEAFKPRYKPVPLSSISKMMRKAAIVAEDAHFYEHKGFDFEAMEQAYRLNQKKGKVVRGGSTISQQVAKNMWLTPERSFWRKGIEAILTWRMEKALSKDRILELYLNIIEWGRGVYGVGAASEVYFSATPATLDAKQAASLAAAIPSPLRMNPNKMTTRFERRRDNLIGYLTGRKPLEDEDAEPEPAKDGEKSVRDQPEISMPQKNFGPIAPPEKD